MFCNNCGTSVIPGQNYCSKCGKQLVAEVVQLPSEPSVEARSMLVPPTQSRVERHTRILAILWLAISIFRLLPAFVLWFGSGIAMHFVRVPFRAFLWPLAGFLGVLLFATAVAGFLAGWGLLNYRQWARILAMVLGVISLIHFPFGTALGIYTLWVLLPADSEREYHRLAHAVS